MSKINSGSKLRYLANEQSDSMASPAPTLSTDFKAKAGQ